ncbi:hypothetical protein BASA81_002470 [Batrachochytrium salamandrivorans]|nr:hypothetical protein BASA81_002470 [Batrachochytrium salamandrivorans]
MAVARRHVWANSEQMAFRSLVEGACGFARRAGLSGVAHRVVVALSSSSLAGLALGRWPGSELSQTVPPKHCTAAAASANLALARVPIELASNVVGSGLCREKPNAKALAVQLEQ